MKRHFKLLAAASIVFILSCGGQNISNSKTTEDTTHVIEAAADTVNHPRLVTAQHDGVLRLTAENGKPIGPEIRYMPEWKAFGWFTARDSVEWEIEVPAADEYGVQLEWSVSDEDAGKEFILIAGSDKLTGKVDKTGSWETFKKSDVGFISLEQGRQKIIFRSNTNFDEGALLDLREINLKKKSR